MLKPITAILLLATVLLAAGCALLSENQATAKVTTQYATLKIIDGDSDRAARVMEHVQEARSHIGQDASTTIAKLDEMIRSEIRWQNMPPEDALLVDAVLSNAVDRLEYEIGEGVLDAEQRVALTTFLGWIEDAARTYAQ